MNSFFRFTILFVILMLLINVGFSQVMIKAKPGEVFNFDELGAIVLLKDNKVMVEFVMPANGRNEKYKDVDIRKDDEILFVNGKKIKSTTELEKLYEETKIGDEIKLGIKREGELGLITFAKADEKSMPPKMMKVKMNDGDQPGDEQEIEINGKI